MSVHTIRLAGPWEVHEDAAAPVRVKLPHALTATAPLVRRFHRPSGLTDDCVVHIVLTSSHAGLAITVNGKPLASCDSATEGEEHLCRYDVTSELQTFNTLRVMPAPEDDGQWTLHAAAMQIHEAQTQA